jgi:hypothetical protein
MRKRRCASAMVSWLSTDPWANANLRPALRRRKWRDAADPRPDYAKAAAWYIPGRAIR